MKKYKDNLWNISKIKVGTILRDWFNEGIRIILMRGPASINVYFGIPKNHPLANHSYDDLPIDCHGGLTFAGGGKYWPNDYFWYGYDYAHAGDYCIFESKRANEILGKYELKEKKWTIKEIVNDSWSALSDFKRLVKLAEEIKRKPNL